MDKTDFERTENSMRAMVQNSYGEPDELEIKQLPIPSPKKNQVLVKVKATSINSGDYFGVKGDPFIARFAIGFPKPKDFIVGWDVAGVVEKVGSEVTNYWAGNHQEMRKTRFSERIAVEHALPRKLKNYIPL